MNYWIQRADFSSDDFEAESIEALVGAFDDHDWQHELSLRDRLESEGKEWCPPGLGIPQGGRILHLCPENDRKVLVHYHFSKKQRILGIFPVERDAIETWLDETSAAADLIRHYAAGRHDELIARSHRRGG